jgi:subtilisin family serine protease
MLLMMLLLTILPVSVVLSEEATIEPELTQEEVIKLFESEESYVEQELIVKFKESITEKQKEKILSKIEAKEINSLGIGGFSTISLPKKADLYETIATLLKEKQVEFVEPNIELEQALTPKDPGYSKQWYLKKIQMPKAWDITKGSSKVTVAVIDDGVQTNHPEFKGKIIRPYDIVYNSSYISPGDHGTHVAGIIAASMNTTGITGVAPNVKIMPINVFMGSNTNANYIADAIIYAVNNGANVINLSLGSPDYSYIIDYATSYAVSEGILVIAAAGNSDTYIPMYPAALSNVLAVSATDKNDRITSFSNYGSYIDFSAPGQDIYSTMTRSSYGNMSGTSMAAPVVSGVSALVLSKNSFLTPSQVASILRKSIDDLGSKGWDHFYGYGRVNAYKALKNTPVPLTNISTSTNTFTMTGSNKVNISFTTNGWSEVSVSVRNSKGTTVRKIISNRSTSDGKINTSWDGKTSSGSYVGNGTYEILVKMTNGKSTITKKKSIKVVDKIPPSIKLSSSTIAFSPKASKSVKVPFELNRTAKVTVKLLDGNGKLIRTLVNNKSYHAGKRSIEWNGKDAKNKQVKDGTYQLRFEAIGSNKIKGTAKTIKVNVDTTVNGKVTSLASTFKSTGKKTHPVTLEFSEELYVSTFVINEKGTKVRQLTKNKLYKPKSRQFTWDGKDANKKLVSEGKYFYQFEIKDKAGNSKTIKSKAFTLQDWSTPTVTNTADHDFFTKGTLTIPYQLGKAGQVTIEILQGATLVAEIEKGVSKQTGSHQATWNGKNQQGQEVGDGVYTYSIKVVDKYGLTAESSGTIKLSFTNIDIKVPSVIHYEEYETSAVKVFYELSAPAKVTVKIYDDYNDLIRTVVNNQTVEKGIQSFTWNRRDDYGYTNYYLDSYKFVIEATPVNGGKTYRAEGMFSNEQDPNWLVSQNVEYIPSNEFYFDEGVKLHIKTSENVTATLSAYEYFYDELVFKETHTIEKNKTRTITFMKDRNRIDYYYYYYEICYKDRFGNEYVYYFED